MSAITGIFYRDGRKVDPELIKKMNDRLSHRGPDGSDTWCEGSVALGHQMLWTTPESLHEKLPFEESGLVITADARIDNRKELSEELGIEDKEDISDSYFILKSYEKWGEKCPEHLLGDFAFAIWDKNEEKLFCARDHMGVKPFYYYLDDEMFVFGTEIKALFCVPGVPRELNERKVALYLMKDISDKKFTFYEDIRSLPSAHSIMLEQQEIITKQYWKLNPELQIKMDSEEDYAKAFYEIFYEAVKCRLRSHFPIGSELSGGLDSSSVVCMVKKILSENKGINLKTINTFSRVFDEIPESDERYYIKKVINMDGINSYFINVDNISPLENIDTILWHQDQPFYTPHMTKQIKTYQKINKEGIRILLSGEGGDQTVSHGNNYLRELATTLQWKKLFKEINRRSHNFNESKHKILFQKVIFPLIPYYLKIKIFSGKGTDLIINKNLFKNLKIDRANYNSNLDQLNRINSKEHHYYTINSAYYDITLGIIDRSVAAFDIDIRYPFYDKRLIEFCYALPTEMKLKSGWSRYILRIAMENVLPTEIQWRSHKTDLSPSYKRNLLLFENALEEINDDSNLIEDYVDLDKLHDIFKKYKFRDEDPFGIWLVILLYLWLKYTDILS